MALKALILFTIAVFGTPSFSSVIAKKSLQWQIKNPVWTNSFEKSYGEFIFTLGKAKERGDCHTLSECLKNKNSNPQYYNLNPDNLSDVFADCADLPYILRAYFSWMNDLPFSYTNVLTPAPWKSHEADLINAQIASLQNDLLTAGFIKKQIINFQINGLKKKIFGKKNLDLRYSPYGNLIAGKRLIKNGENINDVLRDVGQVISTATFRTNASLNSIAGFFRDTYPVKISRNAIKPGTILYDPNGHIAVVYEVLENGKIRLIDSHPDNSLTNITYGEKFSRTSAEIGGGFSNWRPFSIEQGMVNASSNEDLSEYSVEQFQRSPNYVFNNSTMSFYEYVRNKLSIGTLVYRPEAELSDLLNEVCNDFKERNEAVKAVIKDGFQNTKHADHLPENIYGTSGDWEKYSSPSRDARLKASIREGRKLILKMIEGHRNSDPTIQYEGNDLLADLKRVYNDSTKKCVIDINKTNGTVASINLDTIIENIYALSFDPYHCTELRWGLTDKESLKSCSQSKENLDWYNAESGLRKRIDRDYTLKMDYGVRDLESAPISDIKAEDISLKKILQ